MPIPTDIKLWDIVKARCTPLGEPLPSDGFARLLRQVDEVKLDLHNLTIAEAHERSRAVIDFAAESGHGTIEIVTGRSGQIRREFETWAALHPRVRGIEPLNGGGAFKLKLRPPGGK